MEFPTLMKHIRLDEQLIEQFLAGTRHEAETAFEVLVKRHGPMVMGVCRQVLNRQEDAEDAFQATFLALARKAGSIRDRRVLACWLYEVASRIAIRLRARAARYPVLVEMIDLKATAGGPEVAAARKELWLLLQAELDRLPERYRILVEHCYLKGETNRAVAQLLDCPLGTIKGQLFRARALLRRRLSSYTLDPDGVGKCAAPLQRP
jgi:RNA polymerase sigma factor (sigma-70 family)